MGEALRGSGLVGAPQIKDHEDFAKFFRMERMGVPNQAVKNRMALESLDPDMLDDPNAPAPY